MRVQDLHPSTGKGRAALAGWDGNVGDPPPGHGGRGGIQGAAWGKNHAIWEHAQIKYIKPFLNTDALTRRSDCTTGTHETSYQIAAPHPSLSPASPRSSPRPEDGFAATCQRVASAQPRHFPAKLPERRVSAGERYPLARKTRGRCTCWEQSPSELTT